MEKRKIMFYCPGCEKLTNMMIEIRLEVIKYRVKDSMEYVLDEVLEFDHILTRHYCEGPRSKWFESEAYLTEDFAVDVTDPNNPELIGSYFDYMEEEEKKEIIEKIKQEMKGF